MPSPVPQPASHPPAPVPALAAPLPASRPFDTWSAFLLVLFGVVGLCGLFASYANSIPLERALARGALLDQVAASDSTPGALDRFRPPLGSLGPAVLDGAGPLATRVAAARAVVTSEQERESASIGYRTRLMLGVVTVIAAALGVGILALARRQATGRPGS